MCSYPAEFASQFEHGIRLLRSNQATKAATIFRDILKSWPHCREARFNLALSQRKAGHHNAAIKNHRIIVADDPDDFENLTALGNLFSENKKFAKAHACYQQALKLRPRNTRVKYNMGVNYEEQGLTSQAMAQYDDLIRKHPGFVDAVLRKAFLLEERKERSSAISLLRRVSRQVVGKNKKGLLLFELGNMLARNGDYRDAIKCFRRVQSLSSSKSMLRNDAHKNESDLNKRLLITAP